MKLKKNFLRNEDLGLLLLRLAIGGLMLFHGIHKTLYGVGFIGDSLVGMGLPYFLAYGSLLAELIAALMILFGVRTRLASLILVGNMAAALLITHSSHIFAIDAITGGWAIELPMLYLLGAAALCFTGAGKYAVTKGSVLD